MLKWSRTCGLWSLLSILVGIVADTEALCANASGCQWEALAGSDPSILADAEEHPDGTVNLSLALPSVAQEGKWRIQVWPSLRRYAVYLGSRVETQSDLQDAKCPAPKVEGWWHWEVAHFLIDRMLTRLAGTILSATWTTQGGEVQLRRYAAWCCPATKTAYDTHWHVDCQSEPPKYLDANHGAVSSIAGRFTNMDWGYPAKDTVANIVITFKICGDTVVLDVEWSAQGEQRAEIRSVLSILMRFKPLSSLISETEGIE